MAPREMTRTAFYVLTALADEPRHGYGIVRETTALSEGQVQLRIGTLYGVLDRLTAEGAIELDREETHRGRPSQVLPPDRPRRSGTRGGGPADGIGRAGRDPATRLPDRRRAGRRRHSSGAAHGHGRRSLTPAPAC